MPSQNYLSVRDLQVDLHCHSIEGSPSDAIFTVEQLANFYRNIVGAQYLVLTNHCWKRDPSWLPHTRTAIEYANRRFTDFKIFNGLELNIDEGGFIRTNPDIEDSDFNIASIHQRPFHPEIDVTNRILKALDNPYVDVIGHPGIYYPDFKDGIDWKLVGEKAKQLNKAIELNLYEILGSVEENLAKGETINKCYIFISEIMTALAQSGTLISLGSDLHTNPRVNSLQPFQFKWRRLIEVVKYLNSFGITKQRVVNTMNAIEFSKWTKSHRAHLTRGEL